MRKPPAILVLLLLAPSGARTQSAPVTSEVDALKTRIAQLEKALAAPAATEPSPTAVTPATAVLPPALDPIRTDASREAGLKAVGGAGDAAKVNAFLELVDRRRGPALLKEVEALLVEGEPGYPTLLDFCLRLDADSTRSIILVAAYQVSFSLAHLALLHEAETARLAHFLFAATRGAEQTFTRGIIFNYVTVFLRFHRGRFPDLERDLRAEILAKLTAGEGDLSPYYTASLALAYEAPVPVYASLLLKARAYNEITPPLEALEKRNDAEAVRAIRRAIEERRADEIVKASMCLASVARMTAPEAVMLMNAYVYSPRNDLRNEALIGYFNAPRDFESLPLLIEYLNAVTQKLEQKSSVIVVANRKNPHLLPELKMQIDKIQDPEVKEMVRRDGVRKPKPKPEGKKTP